MCGRLVIPYNVTTKASLDKRLTDSEIGPTMITSEYFAEFGGGQSQDGRRFWRCYSLGDYALWDGNTKISD